MKYTTNVQQAVAAGLGLITPVSEKEMELLAEFKIYASSGTFELIEARLLEELKLGTFTESINLVRFDYIYSLFHTRSNIRMEPKNNLRIVRE